MLTNRTLFFADFRRAGDSCAEYYYFRHGQHRPLDIPGIFKVERAIVDYSRRQ